MEFRRTSAVLLLLCVGLAMCLLAGCNLPLVWESTPPAEGEETPPFPEITLSSTEAEATATPQASATADLSASPTLPPLQPTPAQTRLPYVLQPGSPAAGINFAHPQEGCSWFGIAGQVLDVDSSPVEGLLIEVQGSIGGEDFQALAMTGTAQAYGPGGYEIYLGDRPLASQGGLAIRAFDLSGEAKSLSYLFDTYENCEQNLILINFIEMSASTLQWYLPLVTE